MRDCLFRKGLVIGIIVLFIGIAIAPGITATLHLSNSISTTISESELLNNDLVEITVNICETDGIKEHTVLVTPQQNEEIEILFDDLKVELENAETKEEMIEIYNETVVSLHELDILPEDMGIEELQELVTNGISNLLNKNIRSTLENSVCLISGVSTNTDAWAARFWALLFLLALFPVLAPVIVPLILRLLYGVAQVIVNLFFGIHEQDQEAHHWYYPASGWVWTYGKNGESNISGNSYWGSLAEVSLLPSGLIFNSGYLGAICFNGIILGRRPKCNFLGCALKVGIDYNRP